MSHYTQFGMESKCKLPPKMAKAACLIMEDVTLLLLIKLHLEETLSSDTIPIVDTLLKIMGSRDRWLGWGDSLQGHLIA